MRPTCLLVAIICLAIPGAKGAADDGPAQPITVTSLIQTLSETVEDAEVIVDHVVVAPNAALPKHWHHGEEFVYLLKGSVTLFMEGEDDIDHRAGELVKIPYQKVHWVVAGDSGATAVAFRLHHHGKPHRVIID
ncbi:MAG: cupin domain-containing protein [Pseudomonadota bacterium]